MLNFRGMSGIEFIRRLLPQYTIPIVVVSSLNETVFDALAAGAVDFVNKPQVKTPQDIEAFVLRELNTKIKIASVAKLKNTRTYEEKPLLHNSGNNTNRVIAIGASTGGTEAIFEVVNQFSPDIPGVIVVQHMPPGFTAMYADRLNRQCPVLVKEARTGDEIRTGQVLIAPGDCHMRLVRVGGKLQVECKPGDKVSGHCPSVDVLFRSVASTEGIKAIGVLLTGMGADGAKGLLEMKNAGATTIVQDEASCVVYGMPKVAYELGAADYQLPLDRITERIYSLINKH